MGHLFDQNIGYGLCTVVMYKLYGKKLCIDVKGRLI